MKSINTILFGMLLIFTFSLSTAFGQNDTMYIMKAGAIVGQYNVNTEVDSVIFYKPIIEETTTGTYVDKRDGNVYDWVKIGNQIWMAENLAYLPSVDSVTDGSEDAEGSYYYVYGYDGTDVNTAKATSNYNTYGVLYNWTAAMDGGASSTTNPSGIQGVCPTGWHLPSNAEWTELTSYLGSDAGSKLAGNAILWADGTLDQNANFDETKFTALPGGSRKTTTFSNIGNYGIWWSTTEGNAANAWFHNLYFNSPNVGSNASSKALGISVRCVKD
jgi:uncharacterized protein (TIGR02145 family)